MKRDMELIRALLFKIEADEDPNLPDHDEKTVLYHVNLLHEAGLVEGAPVRVSSEALPVKWFNLRLTWEGHDFLDAARKDTIWQKALTKVGSVAATVSFAVLKSVLESVLRSELNL